MKLHKTVTSIALLTVFGLLASAAPPAAAQEAPGVTLRAAQGVIDFGQKVLLKGRIEPAAEGETVWITDDNGRERATVTTDEEGRFQVRLAPRYTTTYQARWLALISAPEQVKVRPKVKARISKVRLFGRGKVAGVVRPAQDSGRVQLTLYKKGNRVWQRSVPLREDNSFRTRFAVRKPAPYRVRASFTDAAGVRGSDGTDGISPVLPALNIGSNGVHVKLLEKKLRGLAYHLDGVDRSYTVQTADAMRAFNKVQGRARLGSVDASTWKALARANRPRARFRDDGFHIEVDQTRQVLFMVKDGKVTGTLHVSTGAPSTPTYDGTFHVYRKLAGTSGGGLYYPSYFDGLRALHGWPEVPTYNASHGCTRLPMWSAKWVFNKADIGTRINIYH